MDRTHGQHLARAEYAWLVPHQDLLPEWVTGVHDTVALRVSDHPLVRDLCAQVGPLISTSANLRAARRPARGFA